MTPAEAGTSVPDALVPAAPAPRPSAAPLAVALPVPAGDQRAAASPVGDAAPLRPASAPVLLERSEVHELCDLLWRTERALCARGWQCLGRMTSAWVALLEERLWPSSTT